MSRLSLKFLTFALCLAGSAFAGNPAPLFNRPVKLDQSGQPIYNSWEIQDIQRRERKRRFDPRPTSNPQSPESVPAPTQTSGTSAATGSSQPIPVTRAAGTSAIQSGSNQTSTNDKTQQNSR